MMFLLSKLRTPWIFAPPALFALLFAQGLSVGCASDDGQDDADSTDSAAPTDTGNSGGADASDVVYTDVPAPADTSAPNDVPCVSSCAGKQCGADGCGGSCGSCAPGTQCSAAGLCQAPPGDAPFGAFCGITMDCAPELEDDSGVWSPNPLWPACLSAQCATGLCQRPVCTRTCAFFGDAANNHTGAAIPDGVEDEGFDSCAGATDGPLGASFRCVNFAPPDAPPAPLCTAGTTFAACEHSGQCPEGEACEIIGIFGKPQTRCVAAATEGLSVGEVCKGPLASAPAELCEVPSLCQSLGCTAVCTESAHCLTAQALCKNGYCEGYPAESCVGDADCSAWICEPESPDNADAIRGCRPRECSTDPDCGDSGFRCHPRQSAQTTSPSWAHLCLAPPVGANAHPGNDCTNDPADDVVCSVPDLCFKGQCSGLCGADADCAQDAGQVCAVAEVPLDTDNDGAADSSLPMDLCEPLVHAGELTMCDSNADCQEPGEGCAPIQRRNAPGAFSPYRIERFCRAMPPSFGEYGASCGTTAGSGECKLGFCTFDDLFQASPPLCSETCTSHAQCPSVVAAGAQQPSVCRAVRYGRAGTPKPQDDLFVPICWPAGSGSSLASCSPNAPCAKAGETCTAQVIAGSPEEKGSVEYLCIAHPAAPGAGLGEPCTKPSDCASLICVPDAGGEGYCGAICDPANGDVDCLSGGAYMVCDAHRAIDRITDALDVVVPQCRKAKSCQPCERHADCTSGMQCVRLAGQKVCSWGCSSNNDCTAKDGGPVCVDSTSVEEPSLTVKTCRPLSCK